MDNSQLFSQAHALAKITQRNGDNYRVTFGLCLKAIKLDQAKKDHKKIVIAAIREALPATCFFLVMSLAMALFIGGLMAIQQMQDRNQASFEALYSEPAQNDFMAELQAIADQDLNDGITVHYTK